MPIEKRGLSRTTLDRKVAIIAGAGRGIGKELARALAGRRHLGEVAELVAKAATGRLYHRSAG